MLTVSTRVHLVQLSLNGHNKLRFSTVQYTPQYSPALRRTAYRIVERTAAQHSALLIALRELQPRGMISRTLVLSLADEGSASMISMPYTVFVAKQGPLIHVSGRIGVPERLAEMEGSDQEKSDLFQALAQKYHHEVLDHGPFVCVACGHQANRFMNHPVHARGELLDFLFPICSRGPCEIMGSQIRRDEVHQLLGLVGFGSTLPAGVFKQPCNVCSKTDQTKACGKCKLAQYCSPECQRIDWPRHKPHCKARCKAMRGVTLQAENR